MKIPTAMERYADLDATGKALVDAGVRIAIEDRSCRRLTVARICADADALATAEDLAARFDDLEGYRLAMLQQLLDLARDDALAAFSSVTKGLPRLFAAFESYWLVNLRWPALRELAIDFRDHPEGAKVLRYRLNAVALVAQTELQGLHWPNAAAVAQVAASMVVDVATREFEVGHPLADMREAVLSYFRLPIPVIGAATASRLVSDGLAA